jgi:outer membrane protein TolC
MRTLPLALFLLSVSSVFPWLWGAVVPASAQVAQQGTLSLAEALGIAEKESETVGVARAGIEAARGEQRRARSELFPQLSGTASYTRTLGTQFAALSDEENGDTTTGPPPPWFSPIALALK